MAWFPKGLDVVYPRVLINGPANFHSQLGSFFIFRVGKTLLTWKVLVTSTWCFPSRRLVQLSGPFFKGRKQCGKVWSKLHNRAIIFFLCILLRFASNSRSIGTWSWTPGVLNGEGNMCFPGISGGFLRQPVLRQLF